MADIRKKEYASFIEETLKSMVELPIDGICVIARLKDGSHLTNYFNSRMMDKIAYAGIIQQEAMLDLLKSNNQIRDEDE